MADELGLLTVMAEVGFPAAAVLDVRLDGVLVVDGLFTVVDTGLLVVRDGAGLVVAMIEAGLVVVTGLEESSDVFFCLLFFNVSKALVM